MLDEEEHQTTTSSQQARFGGTSAFPSRPVTRRKRGADIYQTVRGVERAEAFIERSPATEGQRVLPLPEGNTYLGFLFAYGETSFADEERLRRAHDALKFGNTEMLSVVGL